MMPSADCLLNDIEDIANLDVRVQSLKASVLPHSSSARVKKKSSHLPKRDEIDDLQGIER